MASEKTTEIQQLQLQVVLLRRALEEIATGGREIIERLPLTKLVPGALAHGPLLTLVGLAEAGLMQSRQRANAPEPTTKDPSSAQNEEPRTEPAGDDSRPGVTDEGRLEGCLDPYCSDCDVK